MATSGTTTFNMDFLQIAEEVWERCGAELRSGYDLRTTIRSMNLMMLEWANEGINLWTVEQETLTLVPGTATYTLPADTVDIIEQTIRTGEGTTQMDINLSRISVSTYSTIPNKTASGRPLQIFVNRLVAAPEITLWPVPDSVTPYTMVYWRLRRMQDVGVGSNNADVPFRFLPALIAGLAFHMSLKIPGASVRTADLKIMYDQAFQKAKDEDREKASIRLVPRASR